MDSCDWKLCTLIRRFRDGSKTLTLDSSCFPVPFFITSLITNKNSGSSKSVLSPAGVRDYKQTGRTESKNVTNSMNSQCNCPIIENVQGMQVIVCIALEGNGTQLCLKNAETQLWTVDSCGSM